MMNWVGTITETSAVHASSTGICVHEKARHFSQSISECKSHDRNSKIRMTSNDQHKVRLMILGYVYICLGFIYVS